MLVKFLGSVRKLAGSESVEARADDVGDLLGQLRKRYGPKFERVWSANGRRVGEGIHVLVNGRNLALLGGPKPRLAAGDVVVVFEMLGGG